MQIYDNQEKRVNNTEKNIDIHALLDEMWMEFTRHLGMVIVLFAFVVAAVFLYSWFSYKPVYEAYSTFVISTNQTTDTDTVLAKRLASSFSHAFTDSGLKDEIIKELKLDTSKSFPAQVSASVIQDTNFFTITVYSDDGIMAQTVLEMIQEKYPDIAREIVGNVTLSSIDTTGILTDPINSFRIVSVIGKGILLAVVVIVVILYLYIHNKKTIHNAGDIKRHLNASCIGTIPVMYFKKRKHNAQPILLITNSKVSQTYRESIHTLRIRAEKLMDKEQKKVLLVTSSLPGEGKSTVSINLAMSIASRGKKVLLIDGDLRAPSLHKFFEGEELPKKKGLREILLEGGTPEDAIIFNASQGLDVILGGERMEDPSAVLAGESLKQLLNDVRTMYDYVIFDSPPAAMLSDTSSIAGLMDAVLFIIRQDYTRIQYAQEGLALLKESGILSLGCVMNCAEAGLGSYGYGYYGYRYNKYQYGRYERYYGKED